MARIGSGRLVRWRAAMSSSRSLGAITSTSIGFRLRLGARARRQQRQRGVDALQALDVDRQRVEEDVGQRMAGDLRQVRILAAADALARRLVHAAGADDEDALGAEVDGRRDRRRLAHRAVAAVLACGRRGRAPRPGRRTESPTTRAGAAR